LKLILIVRFACATIDVGHPIYVRVQITLNSMGTPNLINRNM
jgi:hypothetical protein